MINDFAQGVFLANGGAETPYARALIDITGKPLNGRFNPAEDKDLMYTDFSYYITYRPVVKQRYEGKHFIFSDENKYCKPARFETIQELEEIAKKNKVISFVLKWGISITDKTLYMLSHSPRMRAFLFGADRIEAYDKYLREEIKKETGNYPPPEQSMFGAEWSTEAHKTYSLLKSAGNRDNDNARYNCGHAVRDVINGVIK